MPLACSSNEWGAKGRRIIYNLPLDRFIRLDWFPLRIYSTMSHAYWPLVSFHSKRKVLSDLSKIHETKFRANLRCDSTSLRNATGTTDGQEFEDDGKKISIASFPPRRKNWPTSTGFLAVFHPSPQEIPPIKRTNGENVTYLRASRTN